MNLNSFDLGGRSQSEMKALVRARSVAAAADQVSALANTSGRHKDPRANGIPRTLPSANQFESEPMVVVLHDVLRSTGAESMLFRTTSVWPSLKRSPNAAPRAGI